MSRLLACSITGTLFEVEDIPSNRVLDVVVADNLLTKKFDAGVRAMVGERLAPFYVKQAKERQRELSGTRANPGEVPEKVREPDTNRKARESSNQVGKAVGVNGRYVDMAKQVAKAAPELAEAVLQSRIKLKDAHAQVKPIIAAA
jgi:hypothetical protein